MGFLKNEGQIPHKIKYLKYELRSLNTSDEVCEGDESINYQVNIPVASVYADGGEEIPTRTRVSIERLIVDSNALISADLQPSGGIAMEIRPATEREISILPRHVNK